jgi:hypothetical protein
METQKLSRKGLKEIHSVACTTWKTNLENYSKRNTLEDYIELTNIEVNQTTKFMQIYEMLRNFPNKLRKHQNVNI